MAAKPSREHDDPFDGWAVTSNSSVKPMMKRTDWADSDEDEDFLAAVSTKPSESRLLCLENKILQKDTRIEELEAAVLTKDMRIDQLSKESEEYYLRVKELVAEVDDQDRRIEKLEAEIDDKAAIIRRWETKVIIEHREAGQAEDSDSTYSRDGTAKDVRVVAPHGSAVGAANHQLQDDSSRPEGSVKMVTQCPETDATRPNFRTVDSPIFLTPETLKVVPPAPKPKKMTFPMDLSKYGKPVAQTSPPKQPDPTKGMDSSISARGPMSRNLRVKSDQVPEINTPMDIRKMHRDRRLLYGNGPRVTVMMGDTKLATLPKYVLMQCSSKAYNHFTKTPNALTLVFPADSMDAEAAKTHLLWMDEMTYQARVYSVTLNCDPIFDRKNLKLCRAARVLGLNNAYVGHFTKQLCDRIRNNKTSVEFMNIVCDLAYPENDPVFDCLANNLTNQVLQNGGKVSAELAAMMANHAALKNRMEVIEKQVEQRRKACFPNGNGYNPNWHHWRHHTRDPKKHKKDDPVRVEEVKEIAITAS